MGQATAGGPEQRAHPRAHVSSPARVRLQARGDAAVAAAERAIRLLDLSWGGARFVDRECPGRAGDALDVLLPLSGGRTLTLGAEIVRAQAVGSLWHVAIRFDRVDPAVEADFERLLGLLLGGDEDAASPAINRRLEVLYGDNSELFDALEGIASGHLDLLAPETVRVGQSFQLTIGCMLHTAKLTLRARVEAQQVQRHGGHEVYLSRLRFEHPLEALKLRTDRLRRQAGEQTVRASFRYTAPLYER